MEVGDRAHFVFNSTHTLVGLALARTGLDRWNRHAAWTAAIASNLPDLDIAAGLFGMPAYIEYHRGISHAMVAIPVLSFALAVILYKFTGSLWRTFTVALVAMSTHPALDYLNTYGIRPFLPFDETWFYGDAVFIIDPFVDGILILALAAGSLWVRNRPRIAGAALVLVFFYVGGRIGLSDRALSHLGEGPGIGVSPAALNPLRWTGIVDRADEVLLADIHVFSGMRGESLRIPKAPASEAAARAAETRSGKAFSGFARFPVTRVTSTGEGYTVTFFDVRYLRSPQRAFGARIRLDAEFRVLEESLSFNQELH
jgi:inner membrane protein